MNMSGLGIDGEVKSREKLLNNKEIKNFLNKGKK